MQITTKLDLDRYQDNEIVMLFVEGLISRQEFEDWRESKDLCKSCLSEQQVLIESRLHCRECMAPLRKSGVAS